MIDKSLHLKKSTQPDGKVIPEKKGGIPNPHTPKKGKIPSKKANKPYGG